MASKEQELAIKIAGSLDPSLLSAVGQAKESMKGLGEEGEKSSGIASKVAGAVKTGAVGVAKAVVAGTAAVAGASAAVGVGMFKMAESASATGREVNNMSQKLGMSKQGYQEWDFILKKSGTSIDVMNASMKTLQKSMGASGSAAKTQAENFNAIGLSYDDVKSKSPEEAFEMTVQALQKMPAGADRTAAAMKFFGKGAMELQPLLNKTAEETDELRQRAHDLGLVMSDEQISASRSFGGAMGRVKDTMNGMKLQLSSAMIPAFADGLNALLDFANGAEGGEEKMKSAVDNMVGAVTTTIPELVSQGTGMISALIKGMSIALPGIANALVSVLPTILNALLPIIPMLVGIFTEIVPIVINAIIAVLPLLLEAGMQIIASLMDGVIQMLPQLIQMGVQIVMMLIQKIVEMIPQLIQMGIQLIMALIQGILQVIPQLVRSAIGLVTSLIQGILQMLPQLIQMGIELIFALIDGIVGMLPELMQAGMEAIMSLIQSIVGMLPQIIQSGMQLVMTLIQGIVQRLPEIIQMGIQLIMMLVQGIIQMLPQLIQMGIQLLVQLLTTWYQMLPQIIQMGIQLIVSLVQGIIQMLPQIIQMGIQLIMTLFQAIVSNLPVILQASIQIIMALMQGIVQMLPQIIQAGIELIICLIQGVIQMLPMIIQMGIQLIFSLIDGIIQNLPTIIIAAIQIVIALAVGLVQAIPQLIAAIPQLIQAIITCIFETDWIQVGIDIIKGLIDGIMSMGKGLWSAIKSLFKGGGEGSDVSDSGAQASESYATGIQSNQSAVSSAASQLPTQAFASMDLSMANTTGMQAASDFGTGLTDGIGATTLDLGAIQMDTSSMMEGFTNTGTEGVQAVETAISAGGSGVTDAMTAVGTDATTALDGSWQTAQNNTQSAMESIKDIVTKEAQAAAKAIKDAFENMTITIPKPKMPVINVSYNDVAGGDGGSVKIPKFDVSWNAVGGIFDKPTVLGTGSGLQGFGEAGPEAILPLDTLWEKMRSIMIEIVQGNDGGGSRIEGLLPKLDQMAGGGGNSQLATASGPPISYAPVYNFNGGAPSRQDLEEAEQMSQAKFREYMEQWEKDNNRKKF